MDSEKFTVVILPEAEADIDEILGYIANGLCNPAAARTLWRDMIEAIERAARFPYAMPVLKNEIIGNGNEYRRLDVDNHVPVYKIVGEVKEIRIMAVLYAPSNVAARLLGRI